MEKSLIFLEKASIFKNQLPNPTMKRLLLFLLFLISNLIFAQQQRKLDSLKAVLDKLPLEGKSFVGDTTRVRVLCEMGESFPIGKENTAIEKFKSALYISERVNWELGKSVCLYKIGYAYASKNDYIIAIENLFKSLLIAEKIKNSELVANNHKTLGDLYGVLGDYKKAESHLNTSIKINQSLGVVSSYLMGLNSLGMIYDRSGEFDRAISIFNECLNINKVQKKPNLNAHLHINIGYSYMHKKKYSSAKKKLEESLRVIENEKGYEVFTKILSHITLADILNYLGEKEEALKNLQIANNLGSKNGNEISDKDYYEVAYRVFREVDTQKALFYYEKYIKLKDMTSEQDYENKIKNLQATFDNEKKQTEILLLNQDIKQETLTKEIFIVGTVLLLAFAFWFWKNNKKLFEKNKIIEEQQVKILTVNGQLEELNQGLEKKIRERTYQLQKANDELLKKNEEIMLALVEGQTLERKRVAVELHDNLGSTLSAIKWRLEALNSQKLSEKEQRIYLGILDMMRSAYSEVRLISHNLLPMELEKRGLVAALNKLVADINLSEKIELSLEIGNAIIFKNKKVEIEIYSICLELVNNILKHSKAQKARISIYNQAESLILKVVDNGIGMSDDENLTSGIGFKNIKNRVDSLEGSLNISNSDEGFQIVIQFPLKISHLEKP